MTTDYPGRLCTPVVRKKSKLAEVVEKFVTLVLKHNVSQTFTADELRSYVNRELDSFSIVAPASADRTLRDLRKRGIIDYKVVDRRQSKYQALPVGGKLTLPPELPRNFYDNNIAASTIMRSYI